MYKDHKIGIVVPAYNEELLILDTLTTMPDYVDKIFVINDASKDKTRELLDEQALKDPRVVPIHHEKNKGLGQSLIDGYLASAESDVDITAVMAGDNQMHPDDLSILLRQGDRSWLGLCQRQPAAPPEHRFYAQVPVFRQRHSDNSHQVRDGILFAYGPAVRIHGDKEFSAQKYPDCPDDKRVRI